MRHIGGLVAGVMLAYVFPVRGEARFMNRTYQDECGSLSYLLLLLYLGKILTYEEDTRTKSPTS